MIATLLVAYLLWLAVLYVAQRRLLFPAWIAGAETSTLPRGAERVSRVAPDGTAVDAILLRPERSGRAPALVLLHGNAMLAGDWLDWGETMRRRGWAVLIPEFRGYGSSAGSPSRDTLVADTRAWIERLAADDQVDPSRIALFGRSIGGAIAAEAAASSSVAPAGVAVQTAPARLASYAWRYGAPPLLVRDPFDTERALAAIHAAHPDCRVLVIGHDRDEVVRRGDAAVLGAAAKVEPVIVGGTHNGYASSDDEDAAHDAIDRWLAPIAH